MNPKTKTAYRLAKQLPDLIEIVREIANRSSYHYIAIRMLNRHLLTARTIKVLLESNDPDIALLQTSIDDLQSMGEDFLSLHNHLLGKIAMDAGNVAEKLPDTIGQLQVALQNLTLKLT